jgi:hypothetical protein
MPKEQFVRFSGPWDLALTCRLARPTSPIGLCSEGKRRPGVCCHRARSLTDAEPLPHGTFDGARSNGDESDARMAQIEEILDHAAMHLLEKCALVAEWVHHAEAKVWVFGQVDQKPEGGRPEGGIARAARALPVPGKTTEARRKFVERALKIDGMWPEAKVAAKEAKLDNIQSALLAIASERSSEAQLAKVQEIAARKAMPRRKSSARAGNEPASGGDTNLRIENAVDIPELASVLKEISTVEEEAQLATLKASWTDDRVLKRDLWESAPLIVRQRFIVEVLVSSTLTTATGVPA